MVSCGQASTAMLLSWLGRDDTPEDVLEAVPVLDPNWGTLAPELATWLVREGFEVRMWTADFQIIDLEWASLESDELLERMYAALEVRNVPSLGRELTREFLRQYIEFVETGGSFSIVSHMTSVLLDSILQNGPVFVDVSPNVLFGYGRSRSVGVGDVVADDLYGSLNTHFVVVYGRNADGEFLLTDPANEPGRHVVDSEKLLCAMTAGQIQCENTIFQALPRTS